MTNPAPTSAARSGHDLGDLIRTIAIGLIAATLFRVVAFQPFTIPSSSMEPGLVIGDYIVVSKYAYGWSSSSLPGGRPGGPGRLLERTPQRGDVVVFRLPRDPKQVWVKRMIGLPGDEVQVRDGVVFINGASIDQTPLRTTHDHDDPARIVTEVAEARANGPRYLTYDGGAGLPGDDTSVYRVPAGHYFMMGDNRDNSLDSRWSGDVGVGLLPAQNIVGRADFIAASWKPGASLLKPWTWPNLRWNRFLVPIR